MVPWGGTSNTCSPAKRWEFSHAYPLPASTASDMRGAPGASRGRSSNAQSVEDGRQFLPFSIWRARINATSHVTLSDGHHVCIARAKHSKLGMCRRRIAQESLRDRVGIWIDSHLISYQPSLSPIVRAVSAAAYLGSEDCGTQPVGKIAWLSDFRVIGPKQPINP